MWRGPRRSFTRALVPAGLTSAGGPITDKSWVTIRLGSLAMVVVSQELGGQNRNELDLEYPGTVSRVTKSGAPHGELLGEDSS